MYQNCQFVKLRESNVTIKNQGEQNHEFKKLRRLKLQFSM